MWNWIQNLTPVFRLVQRQCQCEDWYRINRGTFKTEIYLRKVSRTTGRGVPSVVDPRTTRLRTSKAQPAAAPSISSRAFRRGYSIMLIVKGTILPYVTSRNAQGLHPANPQRARTKATSRPAVEWVLPSGINLHASVSCCVGDGSCCHACFLFLLLLWVACFS